MKRIRVAQFGLGPIGIETLKLVAAKPWAELVGAVDIDPLKAGKDLGEITGLKPLKGRRVFSSLSGLLNQTAPQVIFHTTVSRFADAFAQIEPMARQGISVVSSCEELIYPQLRNPDLAAKLDALCKRTGARVIGAGVNPGFVMDVLPLCLTGVSCEVRSITIERVVNASTRRLPLQKKIGSGQPPKHFSQWLRRGKAGHAGLRESLALLAHGLGWKLGPIKETAEAVVANHDIQTQYFEVKRGQTCGLHQRAEARIAGGRQLTLDLKMYLDAPDPHDRIMVKGEPNLEVEFKGGVAGDAATVAALVNTAPRLLQAAPGLRLMTDLALPRMAMSSRTS